VANCYLRTRKLRRCAEHLIPNGAGVGGCFPGLRHIKNELNLKAYADYRPVRSVPHSIFADRGIWSYSYKA
jgi:hypothetical protein